MSNRNAVAGTNLEYARSHNRRAVLEAVRRAGTLSRAEIARETALTGQTISNIVEELEHGGLLVAGQPRRGARGQPSIPYAINPTGAWSLGFHVDHRAIVGALVDLTGDTVALRSMEAYQPSPVDAIESLRVMTASLLEQGSVSPDRVLGAGLALPVRFGVGTITTAGPTTLPGWDEPEVGRRISKAIGLPVLIENDAMAAAIKERLGGAAREIESFIHLFVDDGLGAGIMLGGQPWRGASLNAGEIGHMIIEPGGRSCPCGNRGCLERYVSLRAAYECVSATPEKGSPQLIADLDAAESPALSAWIEEAAPRLARAVSMLESTLDPETIILGGPAPRRTLARLIERCAPLPMSVGLRQGRTRPRLLLGGTGPDLVALGAAALPIFNQFNPRFDVLLKR